MSAQRKRWIGILLCAGMMAAFMVCQVKVLVQ
jgi:hypothetical protein